MDVFFVLSNCPPQFFRNQKDRKKASFLLSIVIHILIEIINRMFRINFGVTYRVTPIIYRTTITT